MFEEYRQKLFVRFQSGCLFVGGYLQEHSDNHNEALLVQHHFTGFFSDVLTQSVVRVSSKIISLTQGFGSLNGYFYIWPILIREGLKIPQIIVQKMLK